MGAVAESFELAFKVIERLMEAGASLHVGAMSAHTRIVSPEERVILLERLPHARIHVARHKPKR